MIVFEKWKIALIGVVILASMVLAMPNLMAPRDTDTGSTNPFMGNRINLGLDLQGGSYLLLKVEMDDVIEERLSNLAETIRSDFRKERLGIKNLKATSSEVSFDLRNDDDRATARNQLDSLVGSDMTVTDTALGFTAFFTEQGVTDLTSMTVGQAIEIVRSRIDETGTKEPIIQRQGAERILIQLPGVDNPEDVKRLLGRTARLGFQMVDISTTALEAQASGRIPPGSEILPSVDDDGTLYLVRKQVLITGDMLDDARPAIGQNNDPVVSFKLNPAGGARFGRITGQNIGQPFAIVLDGRVISAPTIRDQIFSEGQISGNFSVEEADELALLLRAGRTTNQNLSSLPRFRAWALGLGIRNL